MPRVRANNLSVQHYVPWNRRLSGLFVFALVFLLLLFSGLNTAAMAAGPQGNARSQIERLDGKIEVFELFPGAARAGDIDIGLKARPVYDSADTLLGYVFVNTDFVPTIGYSGKPIHIAIAMDMNGTIKGARLLEHSEPIVLIGIPNAKIKAFIDGYVGLNAITLATANDNKLSVDIVSGATVTVIVIDVAIKRAAVLLAEKLNIGDLASGTAPPASLRDDVTAPSDWDTLAGDGSVRRLLLTNADVDQAFVELGDAAAIARPEKGPPDETFIDLHTALVSQPSIGRTLLGEREYNNLTDRLAEGQHALLIMASGHYSFRGSGFVRGGIFDRFQVVQGTQSWLFRDKAYKNIGSVDGGPALDEVGLFLLPPDSGFDATKPWRVQLLIQRAIGPIKKTFVTRSLDYQLPPRFIKAAPVPVVTPTVPEVSSDAGVSVSPIVRAIWESKKPQIFILGGALLLLTAIFYGQLKLAARPKLLRAVRLGFLTFTLFWLGLYANAQLSVVNVLTFAKAFVGNFSWDYFMMDPLLFMLWFAVAASLVLWGRGVFCGWLCPFGAMQELLNAVAKKLRVPQILVPWPLHELLLSTKYILFIVLFGLSLYSMALAEQIAEIEPFKTAIVLKFAREWPFVIYALTLLSLGLFIERFYCRYLCPLGAALAIPARLRTNDWLKRYFMCGNPCQRCANECMVQAIRPDGQIHPNECINCMHCQELYSCSDRCPVMVEKRRRREKRTKQSSEMKQFSGMKQSSGKHQV